MVYHVIPKFLSAGLALRHFLIVKGRVFLVSDASKQSRLSGPIVRIFVVGLFARLTRIFFFFEIYFHSRLIAP